MLHKNVIENKSGCRALNDLELEAVGGGQWQAWGWTALQEAFKGFFSGTGRAAADAAIDAATGEDDPTEDELKQREQAINPQFNPMAESKDFRFTKTNGETIYGKFQDGKLFLDSDGNRAFDSISVIGADGSIYIDTGDGRGLVWYAPGTEPFKLTASSPNLAA